MRKDRIKFNLTVVVICLLAFLIMCIYAYIVDSTQSSSVNNDYATTTTEKAVP